MASEIKLQALKENVETVEVDQVMVHEGDVVNKDQPLLVVQADKASLDDMKRTVGNQLAAKYEAGFSKYPLGRYRDRVGTNIEAVYRKVLKKG